VSRLNSLNPATIASIVSVVLTALTVFANLIVTQVQIRASLEYQERTIVELKDAIAADREKIGLALDKIAERSAAQLERLVRVETRREAQGSTPRR
jgi:hypothetical protein